MARYQARFEVDPGGEGWIVTVPSIPGCRSEGDTLREARDGIREALSLFVDDADVAEIVEEVLVPESVQEEIDRHPR
jgi:predicted RNase H-like HicB family nuclease